MKVPEPRKLKSGTWFIQLRLGGVSVPVTADNARECKRQATLIKAEHLAGKRTVRSSASTLGQIIDGYIAKYEPDLSPSTVRGYRQSRRLLFKKYMGKGPSLIAWQTMINEELSSHSIKTTKNGWGLVTAALNDAGIPVPKIKWPADVPKETAFLEPDEIPAFLDAIRGSDCEAELLLALHSLRLSEVLAVIRNRQWDLKRGVIQVRGALVRAEHGFAAKENNKSRAGTRTVPIMIPRLTEILDASKEHSPQTILRRLHAACDKAGVTQVTLHGLRHTFASLAFSLGMSEAMCQELGGWDDPGTMHRIYVHLTKRERITAQNAMATFYKNAN